MVDPRPTTPNDTPPSRRFTPSPIAVPALLLRARRQGVRRLEAGEWSGSTAGLLFGLLQCFEDAIAVGRVELQHRVTRACAALHGTGRPPVRVSDEEIDAWLDTTLVLHEEYTNARRARPDIDILAVWAHLARGRSWRADDVAWLRQRMPSWHAGAPPFALTTQSYRKLLADLVATVTPKKRKTRRSRPLTLRQLQGTVLHRVAGVKERTVWRRIAEWRRRQPARAAQALRHAKALALAVRGDQAVIDLLEAAL